MMETLHKTLQVGELSGTYRQDFSAVAEVFLENFESRDELGASVSITLDGESVVDLWGGVKNPKTQEPWEEDTVSVVYSSTKGAVALAAHTLIDSGELELDAPVKKYWPEFATNGKENATVRMMLDHSVGVPCIREKLPDESCCDWEFMTGKLAAEEPFWVPGQRNGYHMMSFGWTVGELIRRVSGSSLGTYFQEAIAKPTSADFWIGLPESEEPRVASMVPFKPKRGAPLSEFTRALMEQRGSIQSLALFNNGGFSPNSRTCRAAEIGGGGGISNARGLARIYAPFACGGALNGHTFVSEDSLQRMGEVAVATHEDVTLLIGSRFALGFMKSIDNRSAPRVGRDSAILGASAFGHVGAGGSIGFADPAPRLSFGYTMNQMGEGILMNERGQSLVDAAYKSLGYISNASGVWRAAS